MRPMPKSSVLRQRLDQLFPTMDQLNAFVLDNFNSVYDQFSSEMSRLARVNLLISREMPEEIWQCLRPAPAESAAASPPSPRGGSPARRRAASPKPAEPDRLHLEVRPLPGERDVELLGLWQSWCEETGHLDAAALHSALRPAPTSNGWRCLRLELAAEAIVLRAFPALLDLGGSPTPQLRIVASRRAQRTYFFHYLPCGRGGPSYRVELVSGPQVQVSLIADVLTAPITFVIAEPRDANPEGAS